MPRRSTLRLTTRSVDALLGGVADVAGARTAQGRAGFVAVATQFSGIRITMPPMTSFNSKSVRGLSRWLLWQVTQACETATSA